MIFASKKADQLLYLTGSGVITSDKRPRIRKAFLISQDTARKLRLIWAILAAVQIADIASSLTLLRASESDIEHQVRLFAILGGIGMISYFLTIPGLLPIGAQKVEGVASTTTIRKRDSSLYHGLIALCFLTISANALGMISLLPGSVPPLYVAVLACLSFAAYQLYLVCTLFGAKEL